MPTLLYRGVGLVKGVSFDSWRHVGGALQTIKVYNLREVDELVFLDITATLEGREPEFETVDDLADDCFMPLSVGGGIRSVDDVRRLLQVGADKVVVNTAAVERPALVSEIAAKFGSQCVVVAIDARRRDGGWEVWTHAGTRRTGLSPVTVAVGAAAAGAGEILITSIDRDGTMAGYDVELIRSVADAVAVPVIASGGAGNYGHMLQALTEAHASALAAASMFHFTQQTPREAKEYLRDRGVPVRL